MEILFFFLLLLVVLIALGMGLFLKKNRGLKHSRDFELMEDKITQLTKDFKLKEDKITQLTFEKAGLESRLNDFKETNKDLSSQISNIQERNTELEAQKREKEAQLKDEKDKLEDLKLQFEKQKKELKNEFKALSEDIMKERQKSLNEQNKENVGALLKPLEEKIDGFKKRVNEVHTESVKGNTSLKEEIKKVMEIGLEMREEATRLSSALKGDSQKRGAWGEAQLERTLEMSGLIKDTHYAKHPSFKDEEGKEKQPDYIIKLPDKKHIVIDSKVSLNSYDMAVSQTEDLAQKRAMDSYVRSVKKHIDDLASKDYSNLNGIDSPSFVLMFMPIEPAYIEALKHDKSLFGYGYNKSIILLSHTTLIPILRTIANLWVMDKSYKEANKISDKAGDIYNSVCTVFERFEKLGNTLNTARNHYDDTVTALTGRQGLKGKVERFKEISNRATKEMNPIKSLK